jgi:[NiFe] hydrogenase diaphorase moiety large subunit
MAGKDRIAQQLRNDLGIDFGQTTPDGQFSLEWTSCMGMCDQGPALLVNDQVFTRVTSDMVHDIVEACRRSFGPLAFHSREVKTEVDQ